MARTRPARDARTAEDRAAIDAAHALATARPFDLDAADRATADLADRCDRRDLSRRQRRELQNAFWLLRDLASATRYDAAKEQAA